MPTLRDVINDVASKYEVEYKQLGDDSFAIEVAFDDGRSQLVTISIEDDDDNDSWMVCNSTIGPMSALDPTSLLEANAATGYPFIAAADGEAYVSAQLPLGMVDVDICKAMIWDVAVFADTIEAEALGTDDA